VVKRQIGNAVAVPVATFLGHRVAASLSTSPTTVAA
jgi:site-specific DNA-cytosine methylase